MQDTLDSLLALQLWLPLVFIVGLMVGSFLNVVHLRLPAWLQAQWRQQCQEFLQDTAGLDAALQTTPPQTASLWHPGSRCPHCGHALAWWENIPLLSWAWLRGRCSACQATISIRYPLVELGSAGLSLFTALALGAHTDTLWVLLALWLLLAMAGIDAEHELLPDALTLPLLWLGLLRAALGHGPIAASEAILAAALAYLALWLLMHLHQRLRKQQGMGHGDFKLAAALAAWVGLFHLPLLILLAALSGLLWVAGVRLLGSRSMRTPERIPFGPFLALAGWALLVWPGFSSAFPSDFFSAFWPQLLSALGGPGYA